MKKIKVETLSSLIQEVKGDRGRQIESLRSLSFVFSKRYTVPNVKATFWFESPRIVVDDRWLLLNPANLFVESEFHPKTLGDFVSICDAIGVELYWREDVYIKHIEGI